MADNSSIEWTDTTWNPVTGCTKISAGCDHCYAERSPSAFAASPGTRSAGLRPALGPSSSAAACVEACAHDLRQLDERPVPRGRSAQGYIASVFDTMEQADWHIYQVLTKRSSTDAELHQRRYNERGAPPTYLAGRVRREMSTATSRIEHLRQANAAVRFLSIEPLHRARGNVDLTGIHWVIVGGESGMGARPMKPDVGDRYSRSVRRALALRSSSSSGAALPKAGGRLLDGEEWNQFPTHSRSRIAKLNSAGASMSRYSVRPRRNRAVVGDQT